MKSRADWVEQVEKGKISGEEFVNLLFSVCHNTGEAPTADCGCCVCRAYRTEKAEQAVKDQLTYLAETQGEIETLKDAYVAMGERLEHSEDAHDQTQANLITAENTIAVAYEKSKELTKLAWTASQERDAYKSMYDEASVKLGEAVNSLSNLTEWAEEVKAFAKKVSA